MPTLGADRLRTKPAQSVTAALAEREVGLDRPRSPLYSTISARELDGNAGQEARAAQREDPPDRADDCHGDRHSQACDAEGDEHAERNSDDAEDRRGHVLSGPQPGPVHRERTP